MLRRSRRPALLLASALALATLSACGDDVVTAGGTGGADETLDGFDAFSLSGEIGAPPEIDWKGQMDAGAIESKTVIEGDGAELADGDKVIVNFTVGNGFSEEQTFTSYDEEPSGQLVTVDDQLSPLFAEALTGQTVGSRVALVASAEEAFGETGNPQLGIGNQDPVLLVVDLVSDVLDKPAGTQSKAPAWAPGDRLREGRADPVRLLRHPRAHRRPADGHADQGRRAGGDQGPEHRGQLPRPGLRRRQAVRRELQQGARPRPASASAPWSRAGTRASSGRPSAAA